MSSHIVKDARAGTRNNARICNATAQFVSIVIGLTRQGIARHARAGMKSHARPAVATKSATTANGNIRQMFAKIARKRLKSENILRREPRSGLNLQ
jgi:hypothetical protein